MATLARRVGTFQATVTSLPKVVAAIPCYNEEDFIDGIVCRTMKYVDEVIVIDDGSRDGTAKVAISAGASVVGHKKNKGAGAATKLGLKMARASGADVVVTLDGDSQHTPEEIDRLVAPIVRGEADLVIGSRFIENMTNMPRYRRFGIKLITYLVNVGAKGKVADAQSCFRAHSGAFIDALNITEDDFGFSVQVILEARSNGFRIKEVPISCLYHSNGSTRNPIVHGVSVAFSTVRLRMKSSFQRFKAKPAKISFETSPAREPIETS